MIDRELMTELAEAKGGAIKDFIANALPIAHDAADMPNQVFARRGKGLFKSVHTLNKYLRKGETDFIHTTAPAVMVDLRNLMNMDAAFAKKHKRHMDQARRAYARLKHDYPGEY